ncbi:enoyl-CoA hydratase-related protein [Roseibium album]|uniref:Putative enoyl-CoA hydratase echA8 n=1 Tax=Roseibium album TaxID=311410 RepID=A0A0M7ARR1_9HYPH|nr:enoyl-CoA hydratase-related protein [Roseibium album]CTQ59977.1 putative enoyl-CoA hydratase echA8 [Roseibium album]CTQ76940.1 putative enoyl-CoA hydratase echA8 [Roseibium album]CTQ77306.1 putative enoyl-CoA hydratase echA8 [Roseibium album]
MFETIETGIRDRVATIRLNRPRQLNALNTQVMEEVLEAAAAFEADKKVGCLVLSGNERAFAAGADIAELAAQDYASMQASDFFSGWDRFAALRLPKIAVIDGYALGGGCELAMMCDVILASENARFGQPEIKIGCIPGIGGTQRLTKLVGRTMAMDMILTGRMIDAAEALRIGLVSRVIPRDNLETEVNEVARSIAEFPRDIVQMARACVNMAENSTLDMGIRYERQTYHALHGLPAQREGMSAFLEKRTPRFNEG